MAKESLIDDHVSVPQCKRAIDAIHAHHSKHTEKQRETELLPGKEQNLWLQVTVKKISSVHRFKPVKIPIAHPLVDPRVSAVCLITKNPQREYKDLLEQHGVKFISRVVGIDKLKGKFKSFEARRMLLKENGLFLADERIVPLLPNLLGTKFFKAKKQPIPVCLTRKDLKSELERAYILHPLKTCKRPLPEIVKSIKGEWDNVQSLMVKTNSSTALPVWSCDLGAGEGGRWAGLVALDSEAGSDLEADDEMVVDEPRKGKKRAVVEEEAEPEEPKKKVKGADGKAKAKASVPVPAPAPPTTAAVPDAGPKPKKRKSDVNSAADSKDPGSARKSSKTDKVTASGAAPTSQGAEKKLKSALKKPAEAPVVEQKKKSKVEAPVPALSSDELKLKRSGKPGEKKKEGVLKAKSGSVKSAKDKVIGKKKAT
ncbi:ribosomal protein L1p/L10e family-domain-containing protein [Roridomyces roridus]|uniref:Ribosomal L1 domain-containing protein 1 n=1 Tax=Roridomyces roridus TaxID=1738132 RepID=A0AAD7CC10_9AGAR|nr:ribosomal protein L1p/L10e family-domain-containing protein [Roridomyces roridus]